ncbi:MAG: alpha/beta hydrolase [Ruminococcaceae bacterium]|nr:alpha/beta hydrolase [Oscillospiraceae bacterium]
MKKICALFLSVVMMLTLCMPAFAVEAEEKPVYDGNPVVIVRGIDFGGLTYAESGEKAMKIEVFDVLNLVFDLVMGKFVLNNPTFLQDSILEAVWAVMGPIASNPDGSSVDENVTMKQYYGSLDEFPELMEESFGGSGEGGLAMEMCDEIGAENVYYFTYDWRKNPETIAKELDRMIDLALEKSGKDKVHLAALSMGGMVTTAYMYYQGNDKLDSVAYLSAAHNGTYVCGDALNGRIVFTKDTLETFVLSLMPNDGLDILTRMLLLVAKALGATDMLCDFLNGFVADSSEAAYNGGLRDILGTAVGMWALCPDDDFASGMDFIFSGSEDKYADVISQLKETEKFVCSTEETIAKAYEDGVKVVFTSNYNQPLIPIYPRADLNSDSTLESDLTSNFATIAPYGETLSAEYISSVAPEFVSADRVVDASTCHYPDNTWFIKDADHVAFLHGSAFAAFAVDLILSETQPTVNTYSEYPRFMTVDEAYNLYPLV